MKRFFLLAAAALGALACSSSTPHTSTSEAIVTMPTPERAPDPGGLGSIQTRNERGEVGKLRLEKVSVKAKQAGDVAEVVVEHTFRSDADAPLEGVFRFPMPDGAVVTGLAMMVDGRMMEGELVDNEKARKIYDEIVDAMQDPALLQWDHGSTFKMRVFPIEPGASKVVAMRYLVPLTQTKNGLAFIQGTRSIDTESGAESTIAELDVEWNGKQAFAEKNVARGRTATMAATKPSSVLREERDDGSYAVVHVHPDWSAIPANAAAAPKNWIVVVDTSRSTLEERKLEMETLRTVLTSLPTSSRFLTATSDLETHLQPSGFAEARPETIENAVRFVDAVPPDGATDLGEMIRVVGEAAAKEKDVGVVYIGDGEPSWGETSAVRLRERAKRSLAGVPVYPLLLGSSVDADIAGEIASATLGRVTRARAAEDVTAFAASLGSSSKRLIDAELVQVPGTVILPVGKRTLDEGEDLVAYVRTEHGQTPPKTIALRAMAGEKPYETTVPLDGSPTALVARRFGAQWVHELERAGKPKDEIVQASLAYSVMSKHTSFLVLESEEAYQRYAIARRAAKANDPHVGSVDSLDPQAANISLDRVQPGDPEITIDAPRDATRVFVTFPDGEMKVASYDADALGGHGAWMVRFLVDRGTPQGTYAARVFIEYADGHGETRAVKYVVDTTAPTLDVHVTPARGNPRRFLITVKQVAPKEEVDTHRVEVRTPDGQTIALTAIRWGEFQGTWTSRGPISGRTIHVVGFDVAFNHTSIDVALP